MVGNIAFRIPKSKIREIDEKVMECFIITLLKRMI
jgi:hypothetical protein